MCEVTVCAGQYTEANIPDTKAKSKWFTSAETRSNKRHGGPKHAQEDRPMPLPDEHGLGHRMVGLLVGKKKENIFSHNFGFLNEIPRLSSKSKQSEVLNVANLKRVSSRKIRQSTKAAVRNNEAVIRH